jgi:hypothetical protein
MKLEIVICGFATVGLLLSGCTSSKSLESKAKISKSEAQTVALAQAPGGAVQEAELEKEHGKLVWSFDISKPGTSDITEVQVDAITGAVVSVQNESAESEAAEKAHEKREGKKHEKDDDGEKENK